MRWVIRGLLGVAVLIGLAVAAVLLMPADRVARLAADQVQKATGRSLTVAGGVRPSLWPEIGVETGAVTLANADWSEAGPMLSAEGLAVGIDLSALLRGEIAVREVTVLAPRILLERAADGRVNWDFSAGTLAAADPAVPDAVSDAAPDATGPDADQGPGALAGLTLDRGEISDGDLVYLDHASGARTELSGVDATIALPDRDGPADLKLTAVLNGQEIGLSARLGHAAALAAGDPTRLTLESALGRASLAFDGQLDLAPLSAEGKLYADLSDLRAIFAAAGATPPDLPPGVGQRLVLEGQAAYTPEGAIRLDRASLRQDGNTLTGNLAFAPADPRPHLEAQLSAGTLDLTAFSVGGSGSASATGGGGSSGEASSGGWSTAPIDAGWLGALDAEIGFKAEAINAGKVRLGPVRLDARLEDRRLAVDLHELQAYAGNVTGTVAANGREGLSLAGDLDIAGVSVQTLLSDFAGFDRLVTSADLQVDLTASGNSVSALMGSLSGGGALGFGQGEFRGLDLAGMLVNLDPSYMGAGARTIFDSISASFTIDRGVLSNSDLSISAPLLTARGSGHVGLAARTLDYTIVPTALPGAESGGVSVPLRITGPWAAPNVRLDVEALAEARLKQEREALEQKARERAAEELGAGSDESLEDAARRRLGEEASKGLRKLFGD
ncbi:AsmA family protein [Rhodovulum visakhapatnamense]|uniref:AsmA protein n=1 Tax=Rhodovulum visakhapatnamense TaxID=364297 RepID=A0A4R8FRL5_9RHOB|nr:AsmA family protein [Rhodovulum visakhapatnamense]TDX29222.1 AsmA protein [Rhodovulum visakhapatnamense]